MKEFGWFIKLMLPGIGFLMLWMVPLLLSQFILDYLWLKEKSKHGPKNWKEELLEVLFSQRKEEALTGKERCDELEKRYKSIGKNAAQCLPPFVRIYEKTDDDETKYNKIADFLEKIWPSINK